eukprot:CAMPEP_0172703298 /NCGR_PEP_ID=MMETSP1074-20121228/37108_1 /TAXON_ID=2916 /ORGANISM="Ceratium fusus, Strain PA161109" /LENGTH=56 /DNA_ID=CAMNT_0013525177 /DNA_START=50 /DNA_END=216 /DNA_ORIENTATION=-
MPSQHPHQCCSLRTASHAPLGHAVASPLCLLLLVDPLPSKPLHSLAEWFLKHADKG